MTDVNAITLYEPAMAIGEEKALLPTHLRVVQDALLWKLEGLSDADLRRPLTKTGTNLIGIVKHLTGVTYGYLCSAFGRERETFDWEHDEELSTAWTCGRRRRSRPRRSSPPIAVPATPHREGWMGYNRSRPDYDPSAWQSFIERTRG